MVMTCTSTYYSEVSLSIGSIPEPLISECEHRKAVAFVCQGRAEEN
jgi:hypothetical protein